VVRLSFGYFNRWKYTGCAVYSHGPGFLWQWCEVERYFTAELWVVGSNPTSRFVCLDCSSIWQSNSKRYSRRKNTHCR